MIDRTRLESVIGISPFCEPDARLVAAFCAAGGLGVLDLGTGDRRARAELDSATSWTPGSFGVRLGVGCAVRPSQLPVQVAVVVLDWCRVEAAPAAAVAAAGAGERRVLVEVTSLREARIAAAAGAYGVIARGHEASGRVGELSSFVLLQQLIAEVAVPIWLCGGIGPHTAAAALVGGAAGVVLDSQLALLSEAESPAAIAAAIRVMDGSETVIRGGHRVLNSRMIPVPADIDTLDSESAVRGRLGTGDPHTQLVPVGQDGFLAAEFARRYGDTAGVVGALRDAVVDCLRGEVAETLAAGSVLAHRLGVSVPVAQGPMTRVSDRPEFAIAVAEAGGMPFMALALADAAGARAMLESTARVMGTRPWGAGILGFAPEQTRAAQLEVIREVRPAAVIIAGGRPSQAKVLEDDGITTFLHVPSARLLAQFLDAGARRFVFEGSECGGHIGPRSSFCLWQAQITVLLDFLDAHRDASPDTPIDVLFAGGIHDARSAAMVAALAAPLSARGVGVGVLMGTAYLFTAEVVACGAVESPFQHQVLAAEGTAVLETAPGHLTRCVDSPFTAEFGVIRARLRAQGLPDRQIWERLEELNVGRLRIASKGVRREGDSLVGVEERRQVAEGLFMAGQVAVLRSEVTSVADLHAAVTSTAMDLLADRVETLRDRWAPKARQSSAPAPLDIAIIGMSGVFAGATDLAEFWANVLTGADAVTEVPTERWNTDIYHATEAAEGHVPSKWGGFLPPIPFDPLRYGIPPSSLAGIEPVQLLALEVAHRALVDAGYAERPGAGTAVRDFDRSRTAVVFGAESGGELSNTAMLRAMLPGYFGEVPAALDAQLPRFTEDTFPGVLANVISGRIANRLDLGGANFTVDAACASSLAALDVACRELVSGTADLVLCGGADTHNGIYDYRLFASVGALSPTGRSRAFDSSADGIALGEGVGCVVLKRLDDAVRDHDRVYAVIRGVGSSSDGRSLGLTAPRPDGQRRAIQRAFDNARLSPTQVGLVEAHGTGTAVGDRTELSTLDAVFTEAGAPPGATILGSVKSQIGHTKCAAGIAGLIKAALAIHTGVRPPTSHLTKPNTAWSAQRSPFAFNTEARPWAVPRAERVAGLSGFGFGGTNFHAVLTGHAAAPPRQGVDQWPAELFLFRDVADVGWLRGVLNAHESAGRPARLRDLALSAALRFDRAAERARIAVVARDLPELARQLADAAVGRSGDGVFVAEDGWPDSARPKVAVLFPGQGSQRVGMVAELFVTFPELQELLHIGSRWADAVYPGAAFDELESTRQRDRLRDTRVAQPALGIADLAVHRFLTQVDLRVDMLGGHSYGELVALAAAGVLTPRELLELSEARAEAILAAVGADPGAMAAVAADATRVRRFLTDPVVIANHNSPTQVVISGPSAAVAATVTLLRDAGIAAKPIPVACAFHSPLVADAGRAFEASLSEWHLREPELPVWANRTATEYPTDPAAIRTELGAQIGAPVRFADQIEAMYDAGARIFVESGPGQVLSGLVAATLGQRPHRTVHFEGSGGGLRGALSALAELAVSGVRLRLDRLFHGRDAVEVTDQVTTTTRPAWTVDGQAVRTADGEYLPGGPMPARLVGSIAPTSRVDPDDLVGDYLRTSRELVAAQRDVLLAYFGADPAPRPVIVTPPTTRHRRPEADPAVATPILAAAVTTPDEQVDTLTLVRTVISERTGYPIDMIEPELDLEADLSIDSIKRTELVGELANRFTLLGDGGFDDAAIEELSRTRTAGGLARWLDERLGTTPTATADEPAAPLVPAPSGVAPKRFVLATVPAPATDLANADVLAGRSFGISGSGTALAAALTDLLTGHGATTVDLAHPDDLAGVDGLLHLDALEPGSAEHDCTLLPNQFPIFRSAVRLRWLITVVPPDGGRAVGLRGFVRSMARECPDSTVRLVEIDPADPTEVLARRIVDELLTGDDHAVVRVGAQRSTIAMTPAGLGSLGTAGGGPDGQGGAEAEAIGLHRDSVLLMIGGARGITARFAATAAAASGCRIVLAGRTDVVVEPESVEVAAAIELTGVRAALARLGHRDPAALDRTARLILARREVNATVDELRGLGSQVRYVSVDVTDDDALRRLVKQTYTDYGRLDGVVFAAGVIEDRLLADKEIDSFRRVFTTKVDGARTLLSALAESPSAPRFVVLFGSIAAVLGNRGQTDYAAANDALQELCGEWSARCGGRALTVHWGPWAPDSRHGGMVTPELAVDYTRRGIGLIDPEEGALSLLRELAWGDESLRAVVYTASQW